MLPIRYVSIIYCGSVTNATIFFPKYFSDLGGGMVYLCGEKEKKVNGGVHAYFLSVCPACCACALRANVTMCREDRHPPGEGIIRK